MRTLLLTHFSLLWVAVIGSGNHFRISVINLDKDKARLAGIDKTAELCFPFKLLMDSGIKAAHGEKCSGGLGRAVAGCLWETAQ